VPTPQNENVKRKARNRDNRINHEFQQIKRSEHVVNTFFNNNLLETRLMSLTKAILGKKRETRIPKKLKNDASSFLLYRQVQDRENKNKEAIQNHPQRPRRVL
jgi:hypothetical protein